LADFGFAICKNISFAEELTYYNVGTPIYMPPETLMQNKYSMKSDIWATGIVLYELLFSKNIDSILDSYPFVSNSEPLLI
jgi:serine/threonine protein kinase